MVLCACFKPSARYDTDADTAQPQSVTHNLDFSKQVPDAPPAAAASLAGRTAGKIVVDQSSARDTCAEADRASPVKAAMPSPRPQLDAPTSIWEKLASHEITNLSPTPEPQELTPKQASQPLGASVLGEPERRTPDLTITGTSIKPLPYNPAAEGASPAAPGMKAAPPKKPWGARSVPSSSSGGASDATTPPPRRLSSSGGSRKGGASATPPSAGVPSSLLKPTAASVARAQATNRPRHEEAVWKH